MIRVMLSKRGSQPSRTFAQSAIFRAPARCPGTVLPTFDLNVVISWPQITQRWREPLLWRLAALHRRRLGLSRDWGSCRNGCWRMRIVGGLEALPEAGAERAVVDGV